MQYNKFLLCQNPPKPGLNDVPKQWDEVDRSTVEHGQDEERLILRVERMIQQR